MDDRETAPLLGSRPRPATAARTPAAAAPWYQVRRPRRIALLVCLSMFLWVFSGTLAMVPARRVAEDIICHHHYSSSSSSSSSSSYYYSSSFYTSLSSLFSTASDGSSIGLEPGNENDGGRDGDGSSGGSGGGGGIPERLCKGYEVQSRLAVLYGLSMLFDAVAGLLAAFPFGALADRARRPVYLLGAVGQSLNVAWALLVIAAWRVLPVELVLLGPAFQLLGGGLMVATAVLYAMLADVLPPEKRATWFFFVSLSAQIAAYIGIPIGSKLMAVWSPWVPLTIVLLLGPLNVLLVLFMPETLAMTEISGAPASDPTAALTREQGWWRAMTMRTRQSIRDARGSFGLLKNRRLALVAICFIIQAPVNVEFVDVFIPYYSIRYNRPLADAGYMISIRGGLTMLVMGVLLPLATSLLTPARTHMSAFRRDRLLARASAVCVPLGILVVAGPGRAFVVAGLVIMTLGTGLSSLCRALFTGLAGPDRMSRLFTLLSVLEGLAALPGGPLFAWAFSTGMRWRGVWFGLPFYLIALLGTGAAAALFALRGGVGDTAGTSGGAADDDATAVATLSSSNTHPEECRAADNTPLSVEV